MKKNILTTFILSLVLITSAITHVGVVQGETATELQQQIDGHSTTIKQLEEEITKYQAELNKTSAQAANLQTTVKSLDLNSKKLSTDIQVTQNKIGSTDLSIKKIGLEITDKQSKINKSQEAIRETLKNINQNDEQSLIETFLTYPDPTVFWNDVDILEKLQSTIRTHIDELRELKDELVTDKSITEKKKEELVGLKSQLAVQKTSVEVTKQAKAVLLSETKNQETAYKQIIADKVAKKKAFEAELLQAESKLKLTIDPKSVPSAKTGILAWPLDKHTVTQYFGNTAFAQSHAAVYNGNGHNGIDIGVPTGTPIKAALDGVVMGTGDTDTTCPGASYGKWVFIKHPNGLSTLYAHMSAIKVSQGAQVGLGEVIGYVGTTGYATGPHLHFTVYASQGVEIVSRPSKSCGGRTYTMPIADLKAYLDPMNYL